MSAGSGPASKFGAQGERAPTIQSEPIMTTAPTTTAIAHGLRRAARSPLFDKSGGDMRRPPKTSGAKRITAVSSLEGQSESTAKYQSRYQSGRGAAFVMLGSGGAPISGGPTTTART